MSAPAPPPARAPAPQDLEELLDGDNDDDLLYSPDAPPVGQATARPRTPPLPAFLNGVPTGPTAYVPVQRATAAAAAEAAAEAAAAVRAASSMPPSHVPTAGRPLTPPNDGPADRSYADVPTPSISVNMSGTGSTSTSASALGAAPQPAALAEALVVAVAAAPAVATGGAPWTMHHEQGRLHPGGSGGLTNTTVSRLEFESRCASLESTGLGLPPNGMVPAGVPPTSDGEEEEEDGEDEDGEEETVEQGRGYTQERKAESEVDTQGDEVEVEDEASAEVEDLGEVEDSEDEEILDEESERVLEELAGEEFMTPRQKARRDNRQRRRVHVAVRVRPFLPSEPPVNVVSCPWDFVVRALGVLRTNATNIAN